MQSLEEYPMHGSTCTTQSRYTSFHHSLGGNSSGCWLSIANSLQIFQTPAEYRCIWTINFVGVNCWLP